MVKVVSIGYLKEACGELPLECYGGHLDNPEAYLAHDCNPEPFPVFKYPPEEKPRKKTKKGLAKGKGN